MKKESNYRWIDRKVTVLDGEVVRVGPIEPVGLQLLPKLPKRYRQAATEILHPRPKVSGWTAKVTAPDQGE